MIAMLFAAALAQPTLDDELALCSAGDLVACASAGSTLAVQGNHAQARTILAGACDAGQAAACYGLGSLLVDDSYAGRDAEASVGVMARGCALAYGPACFDLGLMHQRGVGVEVNLEMAGELFGGACDAGVAEACAAQSGLLLVGEPTPEASAAALLSVKRACELKHARSCGRAGWLMEESDPTLAMVFYLRGCDAGDDESCMVAAEREMAAGKSVNALPLLEKGCHAGSAEGCMTLGLMTMKGQGRTADLGVAVGWLDRACVLGKAVSCRAIAGLVSSEPDGAMRASAYMARACELGDVAACP